MAQIIKANGESVYIRHERGEKELTLKQLQDAVEGFIELVPILNPEYQDKTMFCNEEGRLVGKPFNAKASRIAGHHIVGDVILCDKGEVS